MKLKHNQKEYIKKNIRLLSPAEIASDLGIPEKEVSSYLKSCWRPEKYKKYIAKLKKDIAMPDFSFKKFLKENKIILGILFVMVLAVYANSLGNGLTSDDIPTITNEANIGNFGKYVFSAPFGIIQRTIYHIAFEVGGTNPVYFRLPNVLFHLGCVLLVFLILSLLAPRNLAFMAAALFAVHPILSESITWISGGLYAQMGFFFLLSFALYILSKKRLGFYYLSLFFYILSINASEKAVVLSLIFVAYEIAWGDIRENWKKLCPFFIVSLAFGLVFFGRIGTRVSVLQTQYYLNPGRDSLLIKIPTSIYSYLRLIFFPDKLSLYHTEMIFTNLQYIGTLLVFCLYAAVAIWGFLKNKPIFFWLVFFIIPLLPSLSPMRIAWAVAERYAYVGTLGILVLIAWIFYKLSERKDWRVKVFAVFWIMIAILSVRTIVRNTDWKSEETLWFSTAKTSPSGPNIHNNLGYIYFEKGDNEKAIDEFKRAISINPAYGDAYHNLGNTYYKMGKYPEATQSYQKALELNKNLWQSHQNLAAIYYGQGRYDLAKEEIKKALETNPGSQDLQNNLSVIENSKQTAPSPDVNSLFKN